MKLILITAISDYHKDIQEVLKKIGVKHYSFHEVFGNFQETHQEIEANWFGAEIPTTNSVLFHIFLEDTQCDALTEAIQSLNAMLDSVSKVHLFTLKIDNHV